MHYLELLDHKFSVQHEASSAPAKLSDRLRRDEIVIYIGIILFDFFIDDMMIHYYYYYYYYIIMYGTNIKKKRRETAPRRATFSLLLTYARIDRTDNVIRLHKGYLREHHLHAFILNLEWARC